MELRITGVWNPDDLIKQFVKDEYQFEVSNAVTTLFIVFYKGTWTLKQKDSEKYIAINDSVAIVDDPEADKLWRGFLTKRLELIQKNWNGTTLENFTDPIRDWPAELIVDFCHLLLGSITHVHIYSPRRNGFIKDNQIVVSP